MVQNSSLAEGGYVQGAADDSESWALGLSSTTFWRNKDRLLAASPNEVESLVREIVLSESADHNQDSPGLSEDSLTKLIKPTTCIFVGNLSILDKLKPSNYDAVIVCSANLDPSAEVKWNKMYIHLICPACKLGGRLLRKELPKMRKALDTFHSPKRLLFCCATGKDVSVGAALAALCLYFRDDGTCG